MLSYVNIFAYIQRNHMLQFGIRSAPFFVLRPHVVTERALDGQRLRSLDNTILVAKLSRVKN